MRLAAAACLDDGSRGVKVRLAGGEANDLRVGEPSRSEDVLDWRGGCVETGFASAVRQDWAAQSQRRTVVLLTGFPASFMDRARSVSAIVFDSFRLATRGLMVLSTAGEAAGVAWQTGLTRAAPAARESVGSQLIAPFILRAARLAFIGTELLQALGRCFCPARGAPFGRRVDPEATAALEVALFGRTSAPERQAARLAGTMWQNIARHPARSSTGCPPTLEEPVYLRCARTDASRMTARAEWQSAVNKFAPTVRARAAGGAAQRSPSCYTEGCQATVRRPGALRKARAQRSSVEGPTSVQLSDLWAAGRRQKSRCASQRAHLIESLLHDQPRSQLARSAARGCFQTAAAAAVRSRPSA